MRVPGGVATASCLCPLVTFLCVVSQNCCGAQFNVRNYSNSKPILRPNPRLKSPTKPTGIPATSLYKDLTSLIYSVSSQTPWVKPRPKIVTRPKEELNKMSSLSSTDQTSISSGSMNLKTRPSSQISSNAKAIPVAPIRAETNQIKLLDKDSHYRPKRGWIWNQFFVLEEHMGPEPQYVGKVSCSTPVTHFCNIFTFI